MIIVNRYSYRLLSILLAVAFIACESIQEVDENTSLTKVMEIDGNADIELYFSPGEMAVNSTGRIFITDPIAMKVLAFDAMGNYLFDFGRPGEAPGEFNSMSFRCDIDSNDNLYIVDNPCWIQMFDSEGEYLKEILPDVEKIIDMAVFSPNTIFLSSAAYTNWNDFHPIIRVNQEGVVVNRFGYVDVDIENMPNWEKFAVSSCVIDVDDEGYLYYTSIVDYRVFKYDLEGNLIFTVKGETPFEASYEPQPPYGQRTLSPVIVDLCVAENRIYVLWGQGFDERGSRVDVFDKDSGEILGYFYTQLASDQHNVFIEIYNGTDFYTASYDDALVCKFEMN